MSMKSETRAMVGGISFIALIVATAFSFIVGIFSWFTQDLEMGFYSFISAALCCAALIGVLEFIAGGQNTTTEA